MIGCEASQSMFVMFFSFVFQLRPQSCFFLLPCFAFESRPPSCFLFCLVFLFHWNLILLGLPHCFPRTAVGKQSWTGGIFWRKKKQNNFLNLCFHTMYAFKHIIVNYNQKLSLLLKNVINDQPLKSAIVGVAKFENMNLQIIFWSSKPSALYTCFTLSINLAWMDDKYKDVESKYESRDIWRISKRPLNNIWNPALLQHLRNFIYCLNLLNCV